MQWRAHRLWKRRGGAGLARLWGRRGAQDSRAGARPGRCCRPRRANTSDPPCASGGPAPRVRRPPAGAVRVRTGVQASVTRAQRRAHAPCAPGGAEGAERRAKVARRRQPRRSARTARVLHTVGLPCASVGTRLSVGPAIRFCAGSALPSASVGPYLSAPRVCQRRCAM